YAFIRLIPRTRAHPRPAPSPTQFMSKALCIGILLAPAVLTGVVNVARHYSPPGYLETTSASAVDLVRDHAAGIYASLSRVPQVADWSSGPWGAGELPVAGAKQLAARLSPLWAESPTPTVQLETQAASTSIAAWVAFTAVMSTALITFGMAIGTHINEPHQPETCKRCDTARHEADARPPMRYREEVEQEMDDICKWVAMIEITPPVYERRPAPRHRVIDAIAKAVNAATDELGMIIKMLKELRFNAGE
ncbi:hypothetical protein H4R21_005633, partial [Coemansia helicoidea]